MGKLLVLWDVDHTLIDAGGLSSHLYGMVFAELFGRELPRVAPMAGRTDRAIIVETLILAGVASPREHVPAFIEELTRSGVLLATGGLDAGTHVSSSGDESLQERKEHKGDVLQYRRLGSFVAVQAGEIFRRAEAFIFLCRSVPSSIISA